MRSLKPLLFSMVLIGACQTTPTVETGSLSKSALETASEQGPLINATEVVAVVASNDIATDLEQKAAHWGYALKRKEPLDGLGLLVLTFDCPPGIDPHVASRELERLSPQSNVGANHRYSFQAALPALQAMPQAPRHYANALIEWPENGCEVKRSIGMIDGGIDPDANILRVASIQSKSFINTISPKAVEHGTAVAEILVGPGRLSGGTLYSAAVVGMDADGEIYSGVEPMLKALDWMVKSDVEVVNISLAGPYNRALQRGVDRAVDKGIVIVAAVGNSGADSGPQFPAALPSVIAATAVDADGLVYKKAVHGPHVDVSAPGVDVWLDEQNRYLSGTSVAAPFIAAMIAADANLATAKSSKQLRQKLRTASHDLGEAGPDPIYGAGLLQFNRACKAG